MKVEELEKLQKKIAQAKDQKARAEGALEKIKQDLEKEFGVKTIEEAQKKCEELKKELSSAEKKLEETLDKIESITDWDKI